MPITNMSSNYHSADGLKPNDAANRRSARRQLDKDLPIPSEGPHQNSVEEHTLELQHASLPNTVIRVALQINPRQGDLPAAQASQGNASDRSNESTKFMTDDGIEQFHPFTPRAREMVLAELDYFLGTDVGRNWGEIALLKAGGIDHRLVARIRNNESFRTGSIDDLFTTINKALRGELNPEEFRNTKRTREAAASSDQSSRLKEGANAGSSKRRVNVRRSGPKHT